MLNYDAKTLSFPEVTTEDSAYAPHRITAGPVLQLKTPLYLQAWVLLV